MDWVRAIIVIICLLIMASPLAYYLGLSWSRGFHRGKKEYISDILNNKLSNEECSNVKDKEDLDAS